MSGTTERCKVHPDEVYTFYCGTHDMVYCPVCIVADHEECIDIYFINEAPPIGENAEEELCEQFTDIVESIDKLKQPIESELAAFIQEKTNILNELNTLRDELISKVDELIGKARDDIHAEYQVDEDQFNEDLEKLSIVLTAVNCAKSRSNLGAKKSKEQALVDLKLGYHRLTAVQDMANGLKLSQNKKVAPSLFLEKHVITVKDEQIVSKSKKFDEPEDMLEFAISSNKEVCVSLPGSSVSSDITGMCALPDKTFLLCDFNHKQIKWIKHNKLARTLPVTFNPFDACVVSDREIAVTSPQHRQIVLLFTHDFRKLRSFPTEKPCKGITSDGEHIFAASSNWKDDSPGCITKFNNKGVALREFGLLLQSPSIPLTPVRLCMDNQGALLFTDPAHGVFRLGTDGKIKQIHKDVGVSGLCMINHDRILVCNIQSDSIRAISNSGEVVSRFAIPEAQWKVSMAFDDQSSTLVIGSLNSKRVRMIGIECQ